MGGKWLELLKEIVPGLRRVAVIFNPDSGPAGASYLHSIENAAASFSVGAIGIPVHDTADIERAINSLAHELGGGLIVLPDAFTISHRRQIIELTAQHRLPTIYANRYFATDGGLLSYSAYIPDMIRRAGSYIDRILKGEIPRICRFRGRSNSSWCSISKPRKRSASPFRISSSPPPTR